MSIMRLITFFCLAYLRVNAICLLDEIKFTEKEFIESEICSSYYAKRLINYQIPTTKKWTCHHNFIKILNQDGELTKKTCKIPSELSNGAVRKAMCFKNSLSWGFCASPSRFMSSSCQTSDVSRLEVFNCCINSLDSADNLKCMANLGGYKTYTLEIMEENGEIHVVYVSIAEISSCCALFSDYGGHLF